jgi:hypothetical protein
MLATVAFFNKKAEGMYKGSIEIINSNLVWLYPPVSVKLLLPLIHNYAGIKNHLLCR